MGVKTLYEYFYKLAYGDKGVDKATLVNDCLDIADAEIKANKDLRHNQGSDYSNIVICANYDHPDDAITAISTDNKTLLITEAETCDVNVTIPANVKVRFERGGSFAIANDVTVTFNGQLDAGLWQIFTCTGTGNVILNTGSTPEAYPEWWGAKGDGTTDDAAIFNSVLTQLNSSTVKIMKLNNYSYLLTDTIIFYQGQSIIGRNRYPSTRLQSSVNDYPTQTKILFAPTSEKDLFDITTVGTDSYVSKVYLGGMHLYGNTTGGVTYSRYAINSKAAQSVFENLGIERFQDGIYCNFTMTNKYRDIYIGACSHACIYTSTSLNTTDIFDNVIMRQSPWGAIITRADDFKFIGCLFEALTTGGVRIYKGCGQIEFISCYSEETPSTSAGDNYGMFYINHDGATVYGGNIIISGGQFYGNFGSFLDVDVTNAEYCHVSLRDVYFTAFVNGIKASANTAVYSIHVSGISYTDITNVYVDTTGKLNAGFKINSAELANGISDETGSGALVFGTSPTLVTPVLGVAGATSINFGDNALSKYKEDAWTPALKFGGASAAMAYTIQAGFYTKIGRQITATGRILLSAKGTSTGAVTITGLPFACKDADGAENAASFLIGVIKFANIFQGNVAKNTSTIYLSEITEAGTVTSLDETDFADTSSIRISVTYFTD